MGNFSKGVSDVLTNWGAPPTKEEKKALRRGPSLDRLNEDQ
jgi:hypothetical protein